MGAGRIRRFVLVATAVTGALFWVSVPFEAPYGRWYPLAGLVAAIASAAVTWSPRWMRLGATLIGKIVLAGCVSLGALMFAMLAFHDLTKMGVHVDSGVRTWLAITGWLVATGLVGQLAIAGCRPRHVYLGMAVALSTIAPLLPSRHDDMAARIFGMWILALLPLLVAAVTAAFQRRVAARHEQPLPDARVIS